MLIIIKLPDNRIWTKLMEILYKLEKDMKKVGYHEPEVFIINNKIYIKEI